MSDLDRAIRDQRRKLLARDAETLGRVDQAYRDAMARLAPLIELAQDEARAWLLDNADLSPELQQQGLVKLERLRLLEQQLTAELDRLGADANRATRSGQSAMIQEGLTSADQLLRASDPTLVATYARVPVGAVEDLVATLSDGPLATLLDGFGSRAAETFRAELVSALALGTNPRAVADAMARTGEVSRRRALTIARTEMLRAHRTASIKTYQQNSDLLDGWIWTSAKQRRTCAACLAMDGQRFPLSRDYMPAHPRCRCAVRPSLKRGTAQVQTGAEWLARQDADTQDDILGVEGGALYREGAVDLGDFVKVSRSARWGETVSNGGVGWALERAGRRGGRMAA